MIQNQYIDDIARVYHYTVSVYYVTIICVYDNWSSWYQIGNPFSPGAVKQKKYWEGQLDTQYGFSEVEADVICGGPGACSQEILIF